MSGILHILALFVAVLIPWIVAHWIDHITRKR
jgi:hypothetical protein